MVKKKNSLSNRLSYTIIAIVVLILLATIVYAFGPVPSPVGHALSQLQGCDSAGQILSWDGSAWGCIAASVNYWTAMTGGIVYPSNKVYLENRLGALVRDSYVNYGNCVNATMSSDYLYCIPGEMTGAPVCADGYSASSQTTGVCSIGCSGGAPSGKLLYYSSSVTCTTTNPYYEDKLDFGTPSIVNVLGKLRVGSVVIDGILSSYDVYIPDAVDGEEVIGGIGTPGQTKMDYWLTCNGGGYITGIRFGTVDGDLGLVIRCSDL